MRREENSNRSSFCLGTYQFKLPSSTSDANSEFGPRLTIESGLSRYSNFHSLGFRVADQADRTDGQFPITPCFVQNYTSLPVSVLVEGEMESLDAPLAGIIRY